MKFEVEGKIYNNIDSVVTPVIEILQDGDYYDKEMFDDEINSEYGDFEICGDTYCASDIIMNNDEDRYWDLFNDYKDNWIVSEINDLRDALISAKQNGWIVFHDINIQKINDDDDDNIDNDGTDDPTPKLTASATLNNFYTQIIG